MNLWWEHGQPAPTEPPDGAVVRIIRDNGDTLLAERDDWSLRTDRTSDAQRHWFVHNHEFLCWDNQPLTWNELVDQVHRLIVFIAVPPEQLAELATTQPKSPGQWGDGDA